jgi:hypothetical protein
LWPGLSANALHLGEVGIVAGLGELGKRQIAQCEIIAVGHDVSAVDAHGEIAGAGRLGVDGRARAVEFVTAVQTFAFGSAPDDVDHNGKSMHLNHLDKRILASLVAGAIVIVVLFWLWL